MKVAVWLGALTWAAAGTAHAQAGLDGVAIHRVDPRPLAALVVYYVGDVGSGGDADLTLILQRFGRVLEAETGMTLARGYEATGAECVRAVGQVEVCMLGRLLSGLDPTAPAFAERTPAEVADALRAKSELPQILLLLGVRKDGAQGRWRLKALPVPHMLELAAGLQHPRRARGEPLLDAPRLQDELDLAGASVVTSTVVTDLGSEVAFARLLRGPLAPLFVEHPPRATVEVSGVPEGGAVQLAGDRVYAAGPAGLRLEDVRPGEYHLRVDAAGYAPYAADLRLGAGERRQVQVDLRSRAGQVGRLGVRWGGVALAAAGAGVMAWAATRGTTLVCDAGAPCPSGTFATSGGGTFLQPTSGVPLLPLGYSLAGMGAAFTAGSFLEGEDDELPWISVGAGVALGVAAFALSVALAPSLERVPD